MSWKQTFTGRAVDMLAPAAADIDFADIAHALALINRYDGHTRQPISVAQHCVMGADALLHETGSLRLAALFLLHDAHEAYLGDTGTPVQQALAAIEPECLYALRELRRRFDGAIYAAAGVAGPSREEELALKRMDIRMLRAERDALMPAKPQDWHAEVELAAPIPCLPPFATWPNGWRYAELRYAERVRAWLMPSRGGRHDRAGQAPPPFRDQSRRRTRQDAAPSAATARLCHRRRRMRRGRQSRRRRTDLARRHLLPPRRRRGSHDLAGARAPRHLRRPRHGRRPRPLDLKGDP